MDKLDLSLWGIQLGYRLLYGGTWFALWGASPPRRQKLAQFRQRLRSAMVDTEEAFQQFNKPDADRVFEATATLLERYGEPETLARLQAIRQQMRESEQEAEILRSMREQAGEDVQVEIAIYREYLSMHPNSRMAQRFLIGALERAGEFEESLHLHQDQVRRSESALEKGLTRVAFGRGLATAGRHPEAIAELEAVIRTEANDASATRSVLPHAYLALGRVLTQTGDLKAARVAWKQAARLDTTGMIRKHLRGAKAGR